MLSVLVYLFNAIGILLKLKLKSLNTINRITYVVIVLVAKTINKCEWLIVDVKYFGLFI